MDLNIYLDLGLSTLHTAQNQYIRIILSSNLHSCSLVLVIRIQNYQIHGANIWNIKPTDKLSFNFSGQIWHQPEIKFYHNNKLKNVDGLGGKVISTINYEIFKNKHHYGLTFHIGYKSNGYSLGERLSKGLILRSGLFFKLGNN